MLNLRESFHEGPHWRFEVLAELYNLVSRAANLPIPCHQPILGRNAFTHFAGVHVKALRKNHLLYQSLPPEPFGRQREFALGVQSGNASVRWALEKIDRAHLAENAGLVAAILSEVKRAAKNGRVVELRGEFTAIVERWTDRPAV
jgi:2-isopropylmalate synthase